jgi:hypothetical protein
MVVLAALVVSKGAAAEQGDPAALQRARTLFQQGVRQFDTGEPDTALRSFQQSYEAHPHPETLYNIATILGRLARYREAIQTYHQYLWESAQVTPARRQEVDAEVERMEALLCGVTIRVLPVGAMILIDGVQVGRSPQAQPVRVDPGRHVVLAQLEGYEEASAEVDAGAHGSVDVQLELVPLPARLSVTAAAPGAVIEVDGASVGTYPLSEPAALSAGRHLVRAVAEGYETVEREIDAAAGAELHVDLAASRVLAMPRLRLDGSEDAAITIDGEAVGTLPWEGDVQPGDREVVIDGEGLHRWEGTLSLRRGDRTSVDVRLGRAPSGPSPAWIWSLAGLALAAGATSLGFGIAALQAEAEFDDAVSWLQALEARDEEEMASVQSYGRELDRDASTYSLVCDVSWITAAGLAVVALVLALVRDWGEDGPNVTFSTSSAEPDAAVADGEPAGAEP